MEIQLGRRVRRVSSSFEMVEGSKAAALLESSLSMEAAAVVELLDDLSSQRGSVRLRALFLIVDYLSANYRIQFAEKNFVTLLYACLKCIEGGFPKETVLASRALSLLLMTVGPGDQANELYKEALPLIHRTLSSTDEPSLISAINLLALCAFVCPDIFVKQAAMERIWKIILSSEVADVLSSAIAAWSFILTRTNLYQQDQRNSDMSVHEAAEDALDLLLEKGLLEDGDFKEVVVIDEYFLACHSFCKLVQVEFVLDFLRLGFVPHMLENEFLRDVFNFTTEEETLKEEDRGYFCEREEVVVRVCMPMRKAIHAASMMGTMSKARTLLLKKKRMLKVKEMIVI